MFTILMVAIVVACLLLMIVILAQNPKGGGLSGTFGGTSSASFGIQRTNDFMEKATWTLGSFIIGLIFLSVVLTAKPSRVALPSANQQHSTMPQQHNSQPIKTETQPTTETAK